MNTTPVLLAAALAIGALPALAADHDHGAAAAQAAAPGASGAKACGCKMMMKGGHAAKHGGTASGKPGMGARMAQHHAAMHGPVLEPALPPDRVAALGLDPAQRERLAAIEKQSRIRQWALLGELREERLALAEQLAAPDADPATATARLRAVQDVEARLFEARLAARRDALAMLSPEQRARLAGPPHGMAPPPAAGGHDHGSAAPKDDDDDDAEGEEDPHAAHR